MRSAGTPRSSSTATRAASVVVLPVPGAREDQQRPALVLGRRALLGVEGVEPGGWGGGGGEHVFEYTGRVPGLLATARAEHETLDTSTSQRRPKGPPP